MRILGVYMVFLFALCLQLKAQINLAPNYSFEQYNCCPEDLSYLDTSCINWFTPISKMQTLPPPPNFSFGKGGSSDYFNICATHPRVSIPNNLFGYQEAKNGGAYVGLFIVTSVNASIVNSKEYVETELDSILVRNKIYCIEFYYSIAEYGINNGYYPLEIGALFTDTLVYRESGVGTDQPQNINTTPQIKQLLPIIKDTLNWIKVSGSFIAKGDEKWLTIGNFQKTDTLLNKTVYVYIDDVKLWYCDSGDTISPILPRELKVYPVPTLNNRITVEYVNGSLGGMQLYLYNSLGQMVYKYRFASGISKQELSLIHLASGVYYYSLGSIEAVYEKGKIILLE